MIDYPVHTLPLPMSYFESVFSVLCLTFYNAVSVLMGLIA